MMILSSRVLALGALVALMMTTAACEEDPRPPSYLAGLRVLSIVAHPLEAGPDDQITLVPEVFALDDDPVAELLWSFCPFTLGAQAGYACALDACEVAIETDDDGRAVATPFELTASCPVAGSGLPEVVETVFRLTARTRSGEERVALARVALWTADPPPLRNQPPTLDRVEVDGRVLGDGALLDPVAAEESLEVRVVVDEASLEEYVDGAGRERVEEPLVSFYASAGRFEYDREIGTDVSVTWTAERLEPGQTEARMYVVVRDLRGGEVVHGPVTVPLEL